MPEELDLRAGSNPEVHSDQDQGPTSETDDAAPSPPNSLPRRFREPHRDYHLFRTQPWSARSQLHYSRWVSSLFCEYNVWRILRPCTTKCVNAETHILRC